MILLLSDLVPLFCFAFSWAVYQQNHALYGGIIASRLCSLVYHAFGDAAPAVLLHVDRIGICCMAFGAPAMYEKAHTTCPYMLLVALFALAVCTRFQSPLIALAVVGNWPALRLGGAALAASLCFASAYLFLYRLQLAGPSSHILWHIATAVGQALYTTV